MLLKENSSNNSIIDHSIFIRENLEGILKIHIYISFFLHFNINCVQYSIERKKNRNGQFCSRSYFNLFKFPFNFLFINLVSRRLIANRYRRTSNHANSHKFRL